MICPRLHRRAAASYTRADADFLDAQRQRTRRRWSARRLCRLAGGGAFVQGYAGFGTLEYDIERDAVIDTIAASPDGETMTAGAKAGMLFGMSGMQIGPVVAVRYARAEVDAYTETGDPVLSLNVSDQRLNSLTGSAVIEAPATSMRGPFVSPSPGGDRARVRGRCARRELCVTAARRS